MVWSILNIMFSVVWPLKHDYMIGHIPQPPLFQIPSLDEIRMAVPPRFTQARHKIDTLGGVFCFLGCPFYTQKKFRVSTVLVGPMALNFLLINFFSKKVKKN